MLAALIQETGNTVDVHAFTQDFIQAFTNDSSVLDTTSCYSSLIQVEDEITRQDGIADCLAPQLSAEMIDEIFGEGPDFDRTASRIASGVWFLGGSIPDIASAYNECDEMNDDVQELMRIYNKHFKDLYSSLYSFAAILSVVEAYETEITPFTLDYGNGKNAAEIAKIVVKYFPHIDPQM